MARYVIIIALLLVAELYNLDWFVSSKKEKLIKRGKREYLNDVKTKDFMDQLNGFFESYVEIPRIKVGERQTIETLINEKALLFAKYLRYEIGVWIPRQIKILH